MVAAALRAGFRAFDTSENYANHDAIGKALAASSIDRKELFLADKISLPQSYSAQGVRAAVSRALTSLRTDYLDLLMLHSIGPSRQARNEAWREMVKLKEEGGASASRPGTLSISLLLCCASPSGILKGALTRLHSSPQWSRRSAQATSALGRCRSCERMRLRSTCL